LRPFIQWYNGYIIKSFIHKELEKRFTEMKEEQPPSAQEAHSVISLALDAYINGDQESKSPRPEKLDEEFVRVVTNQVRLFLFAGNDTTSSTIAFCFHMLAKHPSMRAEMRSEHNTIFGADVSATAQVIKNQPALLNQCPYTIAFIKETLRLYPPAANMRRGQPGKVVTALNGQELSTEGFNIICVQQAVHENPRVWVRPREFIPERWLVAPGHELYPPSNAYRPFDVGSRTCIGQPLSMNEIKVVLILATRTFDVTPAYQEWDQLQAQNRTLLQRMGKWIRGHEIDTVYGDRAYQSEKAGTHPADGYPCRVALAQ
jgi:cytochrome P450